MHKAPIVEERLKITPKVGDIVRFYDPMPFGMTPRKGVTDVRLALNHMVGIVTKLYHDDNDALVLLSDGRLFLDRAEYFTVL